MFRGNKLKNFMECGFHTDWEINLVMNLIPNNVTNVLDIGCGLGFWGWMLRTRLDRSFNMIGLDCYKPYLKVLEGVNIYDGLVELDLEEVSKLPFDDKQFSFSLSSHIIEHLTKDKGYMLIEEMKRVTKDKVVIVCPFGDSLTEGERLNEILADKKKPHISCWYSNEFEKYGYTVRTFDTKKIRKAIYLSWYLFYLWRVIKLRKIPKEMLKIIVADYP